MRTTKINTRKKDGRKHFESEKDKDPDLQGDGRNKLSPDYPPNFTQKQLEPEVYNWQKHVKRQIFQHKLITDHHLEISLQYTRQIPSGYYYCWMDNHNHQQCGKQKYLKSKDHIEYDQLQQGGSSNASHGNSPQTPPGLLQGARRVQDAKD